MAAARDLLQQVSTSMMSCRDLEVWRTSMVVAVSCYELADNLPSKEQFNLGNQIRRAAISIPANIAEGHRRSRRAYLNHLSIALGSHAELETYLDLLERRGAPETSALVNTRTSLESVGRMLHGLVCSLERL